MIRPILLAVLPPLLWACAGTESQPVQLSEVRCRDAADRATTELYSDYLAGRTGNGGIGGLGWHDFRATQPDC